MVKLYVTTDTNELKRLGDVLEIIELDDARALDLDYQQSHELETSLGFNPMSVVDFDRRDQKGLEGIAKLLTSQGLYAALVEGDSVTRCFPEDREERDLLVKYELRTLTRDFFDEDGRAGYLNLALEFGIRKPKQEKVLSYK